MSMPRPAKAVTGGVRGCVWREGEGARTPDVSGDENAVLEILEVLIHFDALLLLHRRVDSDGGEVALLQQLVKLNRALH